MYHCHVEFYLTGCACETFEIIKSAAPPENFDFNFYESELPEKKAAENADVIFANLQGYDAEKNVRTLISYIGADTQLILLADKQQEVFSGDILSAVTDIWILPLSADESVFRFSKWLRTYKMSKDLWQTDQFLNATINGVPNLIWYKDKYGIHEKVNDSFCKTVGKTKKQVEGRDHFYIWDVDPNDPANAGNDCSESDTEVMRTRKTCETEENVKTGDGMKLLTTYKSPLYDLDGSVMGTVGVGIDITQERAYEQEIVNKNHALEAIFASVDCGILCHTLDGTNVTSINKTALEILGYGTKEELMSSGFNMVADSVLDEDKPVLRGAIKSLKKVGDSASIEYRVKHKDGAILHITGNVKLLSENGRPFYQRFLLDCTAQKLQEKEKELRQTELVQALSIDYILVCFFDLDTGVGIPLRADGESKIIFDSTEQISFEKSMGRYIQNFVYSEDKEMLRGIFDLNNLKKEMSHRQLYYVNYRAVNDDEIKYYEMKAVRSGSWEKNHGIVIGFRSVDEETRVKMEQKKLLEDALDQANNANKAKSVFLSNMSHDIRTPMNAIMGFTKLAISHIDDIPRIEDYLTKIKSSGEHLLSLINNVLDMSQIESGKLRTEETLCNMSDILRDLNNMVCEHIREKQLEFSIDTTNVIHSTFWCDKLRLNQALINVISNSFKYTDAGGTISLTINEKTGAVNDTSDYEFRVKDNGIGMSKEFLSHIYELFARERNTTNSGIQGTGLGMAITKNIVDMMNGSIKVNSEQGVGTEVIITFAFRIDASNNCPETQGGSEEADKAVSSPKESNSTKRILLVEDNELNQEIAAEILSDAGFISEIASNGKESLDMLKQAGPGYYFAVLMDIQMPVMNGYDAAKAIRSMSDKRLAEIPILAMTANAFEEDRQEALKCGMNGHISKPVDVQKLFDALSKFQ